MKKWITLSIIILLINIDNISAQGYFTILDDDAAEIESINRIKKLADDKGIRISFGVISSRLKNNNVIKDSLLSFQKQGFHICDHSLTHSKDIWTKGNKKEITDEIKFSRFLLDSLGFVDTDFLVYPFGKFNESQRDMMLTIIPKYYKLAFNSRGNICNLDNFNRYYISRYPIRKTENLFMVKTFIDKAARENDWIVFMTHSNNKRDFDEGYLSEIIDYCLKKNMKNYTVSEFYSKEFDRYVEKSYSKTNDYNIFYEIFDNLYKRLLYVVFSILVVIVVLFFYLKYKH